MPWRSFRSAADALPEPEFQPDYDPVHRFSAWLERAGKAEATVEAYHTDLADLVRAYAPRPVAELLPADLIEYLRARAARAPARRAAPRGRARISLPRSRDAGR